MITINILIIIVKSKLFLNYISKFEIRYKNTYKKNVIQEETNFTRSSLQLSKYNKIIITFYNNKRLQLLVTI